MGNDTKKQLSVQAQEQQKESSLSSQQNSRVPQSAYTEMPNFDKSDSSNSKLSLWLAAAVIFCSVGYFAQQKLVRSPDSIPIAVVAEKKKTLHFSAADIDHAKTEQVRKDLQEGKVPEELKQASPKMIEQIKNGDMDFYTIHIFDYAAEDGDIVELSIGGEVFGFVRMNNTGTTISIPLMPNQSQSASVKAIHDGGGGVTFGGQTSVGEMVIKGLQVGEEVTFGVGFK